VEHHNKGLMRNFRVTASHRKRGAISSKAGEEKGGGKDACKSEKQGRKSTSSKKGKPRS